MIDRNEDYVVRGEALGLIGDAARYDSDTNEEYLVGDVPGLILTGGKRKLDKVNPVGSGSLSLNRKADSTIGLNSVAVGTNNTASGENAFAEGDSTRALGHDAHAEGASTAASGTYSHAEGVGTTAAGLAQHVQGKYNVQDASSTSSVYADIVGGGSSASSRKNIEATTWTGDKKLAGDIYVHCNDDSTGGSKVAIDSDLVAAKTELRTDLNTMNTTLTNNLNTVNSTLTNNINTVNTTLTNSLNNHTQPANRVTAGTFPGQVVANNNTAYTTKQVRNITISTSTPSGGANGDIWIMVEP